MTWLLSLITSRIGALVSAGLSVALLLAFVVARVQIHSLHKNVDHLQAQLAAAQRDLAQARANEATYQHAIDGQNAQIAAAHASEQATEARLSQVAARAQQDAQTAQSRANAILARPRTGNACADADAAILEAVR